MAYFNIETTTVVTVCTREFRALSVGGDILNYEDTYEIWHDESQPTPWGYAWQHYIEGRPSSSRRSAPQFATLTEALDAMCRFAAPRLTPDCKILSEDEIMKFIV